MAERASRNSKRPAPRRGGTGQGAGGHGAAGHGGSGQGSASAQPVGDSSQQSSSRIKTLEKECSRLVTQLEEARERIARLEEGRSEAVNRIDWVIDSLHNVLEKGA